MGSVSFALKCKLHTVGCLNLIGTEGGGWGHDSGSEAADSRGNGCRQAPIACDISLRALLNEKAFLYLLQQNPIWKFKLRHSVRSPL
ncbi:hypothetical protein BV911_16375 [Pseudoruegeria sp. SK021]|nr:hypothetical protein BV911_16375 [Pseudoruegeria sp. SK021]